jgi:hypothetical protein
MQHEMRNKIIKLFLSILIVLLLVAVFQKIQVTDTTTIDSLEYWTEEEMTILYLYYIK